MKIELLYLTRVKNKLDSFKFEFFALALTGSIRPELMAEGSSDPTLRAGPQFPRCLQRGMNSNLATFNFIGEYHEPT
jgi:hypothetical protein